MFNVIFVSLMLLFLVHYSFCDIHEVLVEEGRQQYEVIKRDSQMPRYGSCWKDALAELEHGCKTLTDDEQSYLALSFANCFLQKAGLETYPCPRGKDLSDCLDGITNNAFTAYSNFFTHTQNMCYFLQSQVWREETESTIDKLSKMSSRVAFIQEEISKSQQETLEQQKQMAANGSILSKAIEMSKTNLRELVEEFKHSTQEQKHLIFEIFDRVGKLQNLVVSEVSWLYTVIFYGVCLLVAYLVTSTKRTADARIWLYLIFTVNFLLERLICYLTLPKSGHELDNTVDISNLPEKLYVRVWLVRKASIIVCGGITSYIAYTFVDYNIVNNKLLEEIRHQNENLKQKMELVQTLSRIEIKRPHSHDHARQDLIDGGVDVDPYTGAGIASDSGVLADTDSSDTTAESDDDTLSFMSTQTDRTWMATDELQSRLEDLSEEEDDDSKSILENEAINLSDRAQTPHVENVNSEMPKRRSSRSRSTTPLPSSQKTYFLRSRKKNNAQNNSLLEEESPESFAAFVKKMHSISKRNSAKIRMAERNLEKEPKTSASFFSSDEEH